MTCLTEVELIEVPQLADLCSAVLRSSIQHSCSDASLHVSLHFLIFAVVCVPFQRTQGVERHSSQQVMAAVVLCGCVLPLHTT